MYRKKKSYICIIDTKRTKRLKFAAWLWSKFYLVHKEVPHGLTIKQGRISKIFKIENYFTNANYNETNHCIMANDNTKQFDCR